MKRDPSTRQRSPGSFEQSQVHRSPKERRISSVVLLGPSHDQPRQEARLMRAAGQGSPSAANATGISFER